MPVTGPPTRSSGTPPPPPPPASPRTPAPKEPSWWRRWWWIPALVLVVALTAAGAIVGQRESDRIAGSADEDAEAAQSAEPPVRTDVPILREAPVITDSPLITEAPPVTEPAPVTDPPVAEPAPVTEPPPVVTQPPSELPDWAVPARDLLESDQTLDGAPVGERGSSAQPVPPGAVADLGNGFRLQVLSVVDDATDRVVADSYDPLPPAGSRYTLVEVALGYFGVDDPQYYRPTVRAVGAASTELDTFCGWGLDDIGHYSQFYAGGVARGTVCILTTPEDADELVVYASGGYGLDDVFLDASAPPEDVAAMPGLPGIQPGTVAERARSTPAPVGTTVELDSNWAMTILGPASDITDLVVESTFAMPLPSEGHRFIGVPAQLAYLGTRDATLFDLRIEGVGLSNVSHFGYCGEFDGSLDLYADVFAGGVLDGQLCFAVPPSDVGTLVVTARASHESPTYFLATG